MANFKVGQKVVFVGDPDGGTNDSFNERINRDTVYTVSRGNFPFLLISDRITLVGFKTFWTASDFRPAQPQYSSASFELASTFTEVKETSDQPINVPEKQTA